MTPGLQIFQGSFGRVALVDIQRPLVAHAHPHCHILIKMGGADSAFRVRGQICPLTDDTMVLVNAWEPHAYTPDSGAQPTLILALYVDPAWLDEINCGRGASGQPGFFPESSVAMTGGVRAAANELALAATYGEEPGSHERLDRLHDLVARVIARYSHGRTVAKCSSSSDFRVRKALANLRLSIGEDFTLEEIARESGLSRAQLFRGFRDTIGVPPKLYFNALRVEWAVSHLAQEHCQLSSIADRLGFSMQAHFTRFFRRNLGMTPSEYRSAVRLHKPDWRPQPQAQNLRHGRSPLSSIAPGAQDKNAGWA